MNQAVWAVLGIIIGFSAVRLKYWLDDREKRV